MCIIGCVAKSTESILEVWIKLQKKWARLSKTESKGRQENKKLGERDTQTERELLTGRWSEGTSISKVDSHPASASSLLLPLDSELLENARTTTTTCHRRRKPPMRGANLHRSPPTAPNICCCMFRDEFLKLVRHFLASHDLVPCSLGMRFFTGCSSITASILASTSSRPYDAPPTKTRENPANPALSSSSKPSTTNWLYKAPKNLVSLPFCGFSSQYQPRN
jgi:hypothetical protein